MDPLIHEISSAGAVRIAVIGVLSILALFLFAQTISTVQNFGISAAGTTNTITVTGSGTATAVPDTASISFGATATAADVATAQAKVNATIASALAMVKAAGVAPVDISTDSFNVSPHYAPQVCPPGGMCTGIVSQTTSGYDVSENVHVKVHDTKKVSMILDGLAKANVSNVSGPDFGVADTQAVQAEARGQAIMKAEQDAQKLAGQLGVRLGKIQSFQDNAGGNFPTLMKADAMVAPSAAGAPSVPVGQNTYTDNVTIVYQIR